MLGEILDDLLISASTGRCITASRHFPARPAVLASFPSSLDPRIAEALRARGIENLYSHQARAWELVEQGRFGEMAALRGDEIVAVPLAEAVAELKVVPEELYRQTQAFFG